jgi:ubiquinone/menaquinone biosynthesis C-methylase UbiE
MALRTAPTRGNDQAPVSYEAYLEGYDDSYRLDTHEEQVNQVLMFEPSSVLEVGIGNRNVYNRLKKCGIDIVGCDIFKELRPDVVANVVSLPFDDNSFDVVLCAEVLEHLPFEDGMKGLKELSRVAKRILVLTLPQLSYADRFFRKVKSIPFTSYGEHRWELGSGQCSLKAIRKVFMQENLELLDCFAFNVFRLHRFEWLAESLYKVHPKSRLLKFNGYPVFFMLRKKKA